MSESPPKHPAAEQDTKEARLENPSGVLYLFQHESIPIIIDAILTLPPRREFTKTELADHAGVTRQTVSKYIDRLVDLTIIEPVPTTSPRRYRVADSDVVAELFALNSALNATADDN